jgi:hypothetical protein
MVVESFGHRRRGRRPRQRLCPENRGAAQKRRWPSLCWKLSQHICNNIGADVNQSKPNLSLYSAANELHDFPLGGAPRKNLKFDIVM